MRIAFTGVSCTGKTTLAKIVAGKLGLPYIEEGLDKVFAIAKAQGLTMNSEDVRTLDTPSMHNFEMCMSVYIREQEELHRKTGFVTDSSALVHLMYLYTMSWGMDELSFNMVETRYKKQAMKYDLVFRLPYGALPLVDNSERRMNRQLIRMQEWVLEHLCDECGRDFPYSITGPHINLRVEQVLRYVDKHKAREAQMDELRRKGVI